MQSTQTLIICSFFFKLTSLRAVPMATNARKYTNYKQKSSKPHKTFFLIPQPVDPILAVVCVWCIGLIVSKIVAALLKRNQNGKRKSGIVQTSSLYLDIVRYGVHLEHTIQILVAGQNRLYLFESHQTADHSMLLRWRSADYQWFRLGSDFECYSCSASKCFEIQEPLFGSWFNTTLIDE